MWHDYDGIVQIYNSFIENKKTFPCECPECKSQSVHLYIHDHGNNRCGAWIWCSNCGAFAHMSAQTPNWWKNPVFIDDSELYSEPNYLDTKSVEIDEWVNSFNACKRSKPPQNVIEDRFNVIMKNDIQGILAGTRGIMVVKNNFETVKIQFIYEDGQVVDITIPQEELLQAVQVL